MDGGFIKLWRQTLDSKVFEDAWLWKLFTWCLLTAKWKDGRGTEAIKRGQLSITTKIGAELLSVAPAKFYRGLYRLVELGCITIEAKRGKTLITVCNYETYQDAAEQNETETGRKTFENDTGEKAKWPDRAANAFGDDGCGVEFGESETPAKRYRNDTETQVKREGVAPLEEIRREEGKKAAPGDDLTAAKDATKHEDPHSPEWLARMWVFRRRGSKSRDELDRSRTTFEEMIRLGCCGAEIAAEIERFGRRKTEPIWEFEERFLKAAGLWTGKTTGKYGGQGMFDSIAKFVDRQGAG